MLTVPGGVLYKSEKELEFLFTIIRHEQCTRILEIGSGYGRMLLRLSEVLPIGSLICSIDQPNSGGWTGKKDPEGHLRSTMAYLNEQGFEDHLCIGSSFEQRQVIWAEEHGPFDLIYIDAEHSCEAVLLEFKYYSPLTRIMAFHDINEHLGGGKVYQAYEKLCEHLRHEEFVEDRDTPGIGVIWLNER